MSFRDCVHNEICPFIDKDCEKKCARFKNKSDFVKVVRCGECEWWVDDECPGYMKCTIMSECCGHAHLTNPDDFCSYGERKDT